MLTEDDKKIDATRTTSANILTIDASTTFSSSSLEEGPPLGKTRQQLATWLVWIFAGTVLASFLWLALSGWLYFSTSKENTNNDSSIPAKESINFLAPGKEIITLLLTTEAALVGSAIGFYFGEKSGMKR